MAATRGHISWRPMQMGFAPGANWKACTSLRMANEAAQKIPGYVRGVPSLWNGSKVVMTWL